ncbi:MAG: hypothetical protein EBV97_19600 [Rhodobacteraceae bacterium]|nr:hypothetical protein [Paracoccaceae bacterium]
MISHNIPVSGFLAVLACLPSHKPLKLNKKLGRKPLDLTGTATIFRISRRGDEQELWVSWIYFYPHLSIA